MSSTPLIALTIAAALVACSGGGASKPGQPSGPETSKPGSAGGGDEFGPLEIGADYQSYNKVSTEKFVSPTHGKRFVEIWVNDIGLAAYTGEEEFPVGTVIVKESWERDGDQPSEVRGPLFVMVKRDKGFDPEHRDWWYAMHWEDVPESWASKVGGKQVYWRSPSPKVSYCWQCHDNYDREVGLPRPEYRAWSANQGGETSPAEDGE